MKSALSSFSFDLIRIRIGGVLRKGKYFNVVFVSPEIIINRGAGMVMKLDKVLCCMFLFSYLALTIHKTQKLLTLC